jgi:orotidine-5'-phosphate decarboxylase
MTFIDRLKAIWRKHDSLVCVGLDTDIKKIPQYLRDRAQPILAFNKSIIDATADLVCAYKPQIAYYSAQSAETELEETIRYILRNYPDIPVILDAKRADIGSTAEMYAREVFERYQADAVTVNPYLGGDTLNPFLQHKDKGIILLCRTSNPGAHDIQNLMVDSVPLYQIVARKAAAEWNEHNNLLLVVGATYPKELAEIRAIVGDMPLLVPGIGAQGGDIELTMKNGQDSKGQGMIINSSRGIIYAGSDEDFADLARRETLNLRDKINQFRK